MARPARRVRLRIAVTVPLVAAWLAAGPVAAQRLEKPVRDWYKQNRLLLVADEVKVQTPAGVKEFEVIRLITIHEDQ